MTFKAHQLYFLYAFYVCKIYVCMYVCMYCIIVHTSNLVQELVKNDVDHVLVPSKLFDRPFQPLPVTFYFHR